MKKWMLLSIVFVAASLTTMAQDDDMYFVPSKAKAKTAVQTPPAGVERTYISHSGSSRNVDEYNRMGSSYEVLPADTGDVITFAPVEGVYPDSISDFQLTRRMERWDDYEPAQAYWNGYSQGRSDAYSWHSPWYYSSYYPWYDSWYYDPWYYSSWHYGWYDPWYYGYGWGYPYHYGWYDGWGYYPHYYYGYGGGLPRHYYTYTNGAGTIDRYGRTGKGHFSGYRGTTAGTGRASTSRFGSAGSRTVNGHSVNTRTSTSRTGSVSSSRGVRYSNGASSSSYGSSSSGNFSGSRSSSSSSYSGSSSSSSGSFGGSRSSSSGSFGGSRSSGGGGGGGARSGGSRR
jgi:hypothetical protein